METENQLEIREATENTEMTDSEINIPQTNQVEKPKVDKRKILSKAKLDSLVKARQKKAELRALRKKEKEDQNIKMEQIEPPKEPDRVEPVIEKPPPKPKRTAKEKRILTRATQMVGFDEPPTFSSESEYESEYETESEEEYYEDPLPPPPKPRRTPLPQPPKKKPLPIRRMPMPQAKRQPPKPVVRRQPPIDPMYDARSPYADMQYIRNYNANKPKTFYEATNSSSRDQIFF